MRCTRCWRREAGGENGRSQLLGGFYGASGEEVASIDADVTRAMEPRMPLKRKPNDLSRSLIALDMETTLIAVVELSLSSWLVAGIVPGVERQPLKKL